jgi:photosystem II stability/assembly factor-like uncharacterized protein
VRPIRTLSLLVLLAALPGVGRVGRVSGQTAAPLDPALFVEMKWRSVGPRLGGPIASVAGTDSDRNTFYAAADAGGLWRTSDAGLHWHPTGDSGLAGTLVALAIAPSDPRTVYAAAGPSNTADQRYGAPGPSAALYRSTDAGLTWTTLSWQADVPIARILIDAVQPDQLLVVVSAGGNPDAVAGIRRSMDGGQTFTQVFSAEPGARVSDVETVPGEPPALLAAIAPHDTATATSPARPVSFIASADGGATWRPIPPALPADATSGAPMRFTSARMDPRRLVGLLSMPAGGTAIVQSRDGAHTWSFVSKAPAGASAADGIAIDPANPDVVYLIGRSLWRSTDGGRTFGLVVTAPRETSFTSFWIGGGRTTSIILASGAGPLVTIDGGTDWSNPDAIGAAGFDAIAADSTFPYRICGVAAAAGPMCVSSRAAVDGVAAGPDLVGRADRGTVAPDPAERDVLFSGFVDRFDARTGQVQSVGPPRADAPRVSTTPPLLFAPIEARTLYAGAGRLWKTTTGGESWIGVSPEFSATGSISSLAISSLDPRTLWAGTDDGVLQVTRDGGQSWSAVTPVQAKGTRVVSLEASRFDPATAYASFAARAPADSVAPLFRTRDGGQTWTVIGPRLGHGSPVHTIREDPYRRGLLFAGADAGVLVSFDDGDTWQPLTLNLPPGPVRDLLVKESDLAAATANRGLWILDDITPLRQITGDVARAGIFLFRPATGWRPRAQLAPEAAPGVAISYLLGPTDGPVTIEVVDSGTGELIRRFTSEGPGAELSAAAGLHRTTWDLRYPAIVTAGANGEPRRAPGVAALPGTYQLRLVAGGRTLRQAITIRLDPRVRVPAADLGVQFTLARRLQRAIVDLTNAPGDRRQLTAEIDDLLHLLARTTQSDARPAAGLDADVTAALARIGR